MTEDGPTITHAASTEPMLLRGTPTPGLDKPTLAARLCLVQGDAENPKKSGFNTHHNYAYVTAADALDALRPLLAKHGVAVYPPTVVREDDIQGTTRAGGAKSQAHLTLAYRIESADDPADYVEVVWAARANDTDGDKGIYKALTNAQKYLMFALGLVSGEDQDNVEDDTGWAPQRGHEGGGQQGRGARGPSPRAQSGSKRRQGWPSAAGAKLGVPFIAEARKRLKAANRNVDDLRAAIAHAGQADLVAAEDPAEWPASLRDGIVKWVDQAAAKPKAKDAPKDAGADGQPNQATPAETGGPEPEAPAPAAEPAAPLPKAGDRPRWPEDDKPKPGQVCYWRAKLLTQAEAALAAIAEAKGGGYQPVMDAEQLIRSAELAEDSGLLLPDQEKAEGKAVKSYKDLVTAVDKGERDLGTWYVPF